LPSTLSSRDHVALSLSPSDQHRVPTVEQRGASRTAQVAAITPDEDLVEFDGLEWFWLPVEGVSTSKLPVPAIERIVGPMTMRTLGTLERMLKKFGD
jgi:hypothetical protein